jgi:predicted O-methyltransferase YrrM
MNSSNETIYHQLEKVVRDVPGWMQTNQLLSLYTLALTSSHLPGDILEVGSWCGRSAVALGLAVSQIGNSKVHCVDLFPEKNDWYQNDDGSYSFSVDIDDRKIVAFSEHTLWAEPYHRDVAPLYRRVSGIQELFLNTMLAYNLAEVVSPLKGDLKTFSKNFKNVALRMAFIDGDHGYSAVSKDIEIIENHLLPGGWICFDDAFSSYSGVNKAIEIHILQSGRYQNCQQLLRKFFVAQLRT